MLTTRLRPTVLMACTIEVLWLLLAQALGSMILLIPCLLCFMALVAWSSVKGMALPVLLFFLPFATLLKIQPGMITFYTLALMLVYITCTVIGHRKIGITHFIPAILLTGLCLMMKLFYNLFMSNSFALFAYCLLFVPFVAIEFGKKYDFYWLTLFFTVGIVIASISSIYLIQVEPIARYIRYYELFGVQRHSGYYGDPNFYSTHISAALSGVMVLLLKNVSKKRAISLVVMFLLLAYCGLLSVSKTFFLIAVFIGLLFVIDLIIKKGRLSARFFLMTALVIGTAVLLSFTVFSDLIGMMMSRFSADLDISDFTTRRTDLWLRFLNAFKEDTTLLLFGKGYTNVLLFDRCSHNTLIQAVYQYGLVGCAFFACWLFRLCRIYYKGIKIRKSDILPICILLAGALGPWMALDIVFFDELFLMPMYVCVGVMFITSTNEAAPVSETKVDASNTEKNTESVKSSTVSVIMPAYNAERFIREAINSVIAQTHTAWELLVLDDGSSDSTCDIVQDMAAVDERIKLIKNPCNMGVAKTRNRGLELCQGDYVAFLDSDDVWHPEKLSSQIGVMVANDAKLSYTSYAIVDENGEPCKSAYVVPECVTFKDMLKENHIGCSTVMLSADIAKQYRFATDFYHEDYCLWLDIMRAGHAVAGCSEVLVDWRLIKNSRSFNKLNSAKNRWRIYRKHMNYSLPKSTKLILCYFLSGLKKYYG